MKASTPRELPGLFLEYLNSGDADSVASLYEEDGMVAPDPNQAVLGRAAIRAMVAGFLADRPHFVLHDAEVVQTGDLALIRTRWTMTNPAVGAKEARMKIGPILVARRQPDGHWLVAIDRPLTISEGAT